MPIRGSSFTSTAAPGFRFAASGLHDPGYKRFQTALAKRLLRD